MGTKRKEVGTYEVRCFINPLTVLTERAYKKYVKKCVSEFWILYSDKKNRVNPNKRKE